LKIGKRKEEIGNRERFRLSVKKLERRNRKEKRGNSKQKKK
jgi:hypothetical protein